MRALIFAAMICVAPLAVSAQSAVDRLFDAAGLPELIASFADDSRLGARDLDDSFLQGQGGDVFAETIDRLHDPARLIETMRAGVSDRLDPDDAAQALSFVESEMGQRIARLEVEARQAMSNDDVEAAALAAADRADDAVVAMIELRNLPERNADISFNAQVAFWAGVAATAPDFDVPDIEGQRDAIAARSRTWVTGFYMLVASALEDGDLETYSAFWDTEVAEAWDDAVSAALEEMYSELSFATGQAVGRLLPQNEL
ncbi:MAG: hypothetical protein AAGM84_10015 [Pseudomonadota bacterium]